MAVDPIATPAGTWSDGTPRWDDPDPLPELRDGQEDDLRKSGLDETEIRILRERAKSFDRAHAALEAAQRENATLRSGLDLESPIGQLFVKSYDGEWTAEALKAEAARYGVPQKSAPADDLLDASERRLLG